MNVTVSSVRIVAVEKLVIVNEAYGVSVFEELAILLVHDVAIELLLIRESANSEVAVLIWIYGRSNVYWRVVVEDYESCARKAL